MVGREVYANRAEINWLAAARFFLFGSRDVWFVVGLPVFLASNLGWALSEADLPGTACSIART